MSLSNEQLYVLEAQDEATLAGWWCDINSFVWPKELSKGDDVNDTAIEVMAWINDRIGRKATMRRWNHDMSDAEFDLYWRASTGDDAAKREWEEYRKAEKWKGGPASRGDVR